jgi:hypothetical protein
MGQLHSHRDKHIKGLSLVELLMASALMVIMIAVIGRTVIFFTTQIRASIEQQNINVQIDSAFEDLRLRCASAVSVSTTFVPAGSSLNRFTFQGESDIYTVSPDDLTDNAVHSYYVNNNGDLVRETNGVLAEVLVEKKFSPVVTFTYTAGNEPNFITVTITATSLRQPVGGSGTITKTFPLRLWFVDAVA